MCKYCHGNINWWSVPVSNNANSFHQIKQQGFMDNRNKVFPSCLYKLIGFHVCLECLTSGTHLLCWVWQWVFACTVLYTTVVMVTLPLGCTQCEVLVSSLIYSQMGQIQIIYLVHYSTVNQDLNPDCFNAVVGGKHFQSTSSKVVALPCLISSVNLLCFLLCDMTFLSEIYLLPSIWPYSLDILPSKHCVIIWLYIIEVRVI